MDKSEVKKAIVNVNGETKEVMFQTKKQMGEKIREKRIHKELSIENVAGDAEISVGTAHNIENAKTDATLENIISYANALNMDTMELLFGESGLYFKQSIKTKRKIEEEIVERIRGLKVEQLKKIKKMIDMLLD